MRTASDEVLAAAREVLDLSDPCTAPVASARLLPPAAYTSEAFWQFEKLAVFSNQWLAVAHVGEIPLAGDHLPLDVLGEPIIVTRTESGSVSVISGICQHRGHPIFAGLAARADNAPCLNSSRLTCPYHNWIYRLDGTLVAAPAMHDTTPLEELRTRIRLPSIKTEVFHGIIFVNFDSDASPLGLTLSKLDAELETFGLADLVPMPSSMRRDLRWNWKIHHENALEPYHTDYVHRGAHETAPARLARFGVFEPGDGQVMHPTYLISEDADLATNRSQGRLSPIATLTTEQRRRVQFASVPPLLSCILQPTFVSLSFLLPTGPGTMDLRRVNCYPREAVDSPGFSEYYNEQLERKAVAVHQDEVTTAALQRAYEGSRFIPKGTLSSLEATIPQMNAWLCERYRATLLAFEGSRA